MNYNDILNRVHRRAVDGVHGKKEEDPAGMANVKLLMSKDQELRKVVADPFVTLNQLNDPKMAIEILADHIAIMVEMLNEFKKHQK